MSPYSMNEIYAMIAITVATITLPGLLVEAYWWWQDRHGLPTGEEAPTEAYIERDIEFEPRKAA